MVDIQAGCFGNFFRKNKSRPQPASPEPSKLETECSKASGCPNLCCDYSYAPPSTRWSITDPVPTYSPPQGPELDPFQRQEFVGIVNPTLDSLSSSLRQLSLKIHDHPELGFEERYAHDLLCAYMETHGFQVTRHYLGLDTAWRAEYTHGKGGSTLGINSEMDGLCGIGHACGHNLIAISGCGVAIAVKATLEALNIPGKIILLGTPAEERVGGKIILLERGAYKDMDLCIMCHPGPGPSNSANFGTTTALQEAEVEYFGHSAHAGAAPWEGTNALDAAFLAYSSISVLRQQIKPDHRIHGILGGKNWTANVIPDYAHMTWIVRAPTHGEVGEFAERVKACFEAAALATGCKVKINFTTPYYELLQNSVLGKEFADKVGRNYGMVSSDGDGSSASTDFGNVSFVSLALPALHPVYAIPTEPKGGNHTPAFAKAAATMAAHEATMTVTKGLALTGLRALQDKAFLKAVRTTLLLESAL
ncbi:amidohydrolase [Armillaria gallica]|uniref:Amidohydrolase n=1 Tax=Armillaria gallica TaxID=47427 RepID=A0A2H3DWE8_ARMGA|nr:amidohydrolase [Armillaria gallica]